MSRLRGRFAGEVDELMHEITSSLEIDLEMAEEDIRGSLAHARMLGETGVISAENAASIRQGLEQVLAEYTSGAWVPEPVHDDIHMAVEARLTELIGPVGGKLHTARSRNDQVATDVRLWLRAELTRLDAELADLVRVLLDRVEADGQSLMPGYTHLQRGQPILLGHHLLAHAWVLQRDRERLADCLLRVNQCPLGGCAMAGTAHPIDRQRTAELLDFPAVMENAMDAIAARDHLQETAAVCAIVMTNLSRMAEELVLWSSAEYGLVRVGEEHATGSSIMPQKRNPDGAEIIRGKTGRVLGDLQALLVLVKGLPMAYNRDLQEERGPLFDALRQAHLSVQLMAAMWRQLSVASDRFEVDLVDDFSLATELADAMVEAGVPFRQAHEAVGELVQLCEAEGAANLAPIRRHTDRLPSAVAGRLDELLDPRAAAERRTSQGGTAWVEVERQVALLRAEVESVQNHP